MVISKLFYINNKYYIDLHQLIVNGVFKVHGLHVPEELEQLRPEIEKIATKLLHMNSGGKYKQ